MIWIVGMARVRILARRSFCDLERGGMVDGHDELRITTVALINKLRDEAKLEGG
jgi:hypothetical protein